MGSMKCRNPHSLRLALSLCVHARLAPYRHCMHATTGKWFTFNDSSVREVAAGELQGPSAYVLFYKQRGKSKG